MFFLRLMIAVFLLSIFSLDVQGKACDKSLSSQICVNVQVNAPNNQPLSDVIVYIEALDGQVTSQTDRVITVAQQHKTFSPYLTVSQTNHAVDFVNLDDITHHIYSVSNNNKFSFKIKAGKTKENLRFSQAAEIAMGCNIHDWMSGYLLVVDTPYFDKTNSQGEVSLALSATGNYRIVIWHPQLTSPNNRMILKKNIITDSNFTFTLEKSITEIPKQENEDDFDFLSDY